MHCIILQCIALYCSLQCTEDELRLDRQVVPSVLSLREFWHPLVQPLELPLVQPLLPIHY